MSDGWFIGTTTATTTWAVNTSWRQSAISASVLAAGTWPGRTGGSDNFVDTAWFSRDGAAALTTGGIQIPSRQTIGYVRTRNTEARIVGLTTNVLSALAVGGYIESTVAIGSGISIGVPAGNYTSTTARRVRLETVANIQLIGSGGLRLRNGIVGGNQITVSDGVIVEDPLNDSNFTGSWVINSGNVDLVSNVTSTLNSSGITINGPGRLNTQPSSAANVFMNSVGASIPYIIGLPGPTTITGTVETGGSGVTGPVIGTGTLRTSSTISNTGDAFHTYTGGTVALGQLRVSRSVATPAGQGTIRGAITLTTIAGINAQGPDPLGSADDSTVVVTSITGTANRQGIIVGQVGGTGTNTDAFTLTNCAVSFTRASSFPATKSRSLGASPTQRQWFGTCTLLKSSLTLSDFSTFDFTSATLTGPNTVSVSAKALNLYADLSGAGSINLNSAGTVFLSGTNTHAGGTAISAGTIQLAQKNYTPNPYTVSEWMQYNSTFYGYLYLFTTGSTSATNWYAAATGSLANAKIPWIENVYKGLAGSGYTALFSFTPTESGTFVASFDVQPSTSAAPNYTVKVGEYLSETTVTYTDVLPTSTWTTKTITFTAVAGSTHIFQFTVNSGQTIYYSNIRIGPQNQYGTLGNGPLTMTGGTLVVEKGAMTHPSSATLGGCTYQIGAS